jgi:hypothetical protein
MVNTVLTIILTIGVLTAMYSQIWHQGLNDVVIRLVTDNVVSACSTSRNSFDILEYSTIPSYRFLPAAERSTSQHPAWRVEVLLRSKI